MKILYRALIFSSLFIISTPVFSQDEADAKEQGTAKTQDQKFQEVILLDSVPSAEILKRAVNFIKLESPRFVKAKGVTTANKAECIAKFKIKPKELNPKPDYTGTITMHVSIECKDFRYRYVISKITHTSANGKASGGDINNVVPLCGSMTMPDLIWKRIKGDAMKNANMVISELKDAMSVPVKDQKDEW